MSVVDNALVWENSVIFLSAISNISTMHFKAMPFPMWAFVVYILGLISLFENALVGFCLLLFILVALDVFIIFFFNFLIMIYQLFDNIFSNILNKIKYF